MEGIYDDDVLILNTTSRTQHKLSAIINPGWQKFSFTNSKVIHTFFDGCSPRFEEL